MYYAFNVINTAFDLAIYQIRNWSSQNYGIFSSGWNCICIFHSPTITIVSTFPRWRISIQRNKVIHKRFTAVNLFLFVSIFLKLALKVIHIQLLQNASHHFFDHGKAL